MHDQNHNFQPSQPGGGGSRPCTRTLVPVRLLKLPTGRGPSGPGSSSHCVVTERSPTTAAAGPASSPARTSAGGRPCHQSHLRTREAASGRAARRSRPRSRRRPCGSAVCPVPSGPSRSTGARARRIDTQVPTSPWRSSSERVPVVAAAAGVAQPPFVGSGVPAKASSPSTSSPPDRNGKLSRLQGRPPPVR